MREGEGERRREKEREGERGGGIQRQVIGLFNDLQTTFLIYDTLESASIYIIML